MKLTNLLILALVSTFFVPALAGPKPTDPTYDQEPGLDEEDDEDCDFEKDEHKILQKIRDLANDKKKAQPAMDTIDNMIFRKTQSQEKLAKRLAKEPKLEYDCDLKQNDD